jgi:hypothetical protein
MGWDLKRGSAIVSRKVGLGERLSQENRKRAEEKIDIQ